MKIAIASVEKNEDSKISARGGRAPYYLIFDEKGKFIEVIANPFNMGGGGAGIAVAKMLADMGINVFLAGMVGDKMADALDERGVKYFGREGNVKTVLGNFLKEK
jgi:predicted Fe-Mo cluster-binding NifX family protein